MYQSEFRRCSKEDIEAANRFLFKAENAVLHWLNIFKDDFKVALPCYLVGKIPPGCRFVPVSPIFGAHAGFPQSVTNLRKTLVYLHSQGISIPAPKLNEQIRLFCRLIRHCAVPRQERDFHTLKRLTLDCLDYIRNDREKPVDDDIFEGILKDRTVEILTLLAGPLSDNMMEREQSVISGEGFVFPNRDLEDFAPEMNDFTPAPTAEEKLVAGIEDLKRDSAIQQQQNAVIIAQGQQQIAQHAAFEDKIDYANPKTAREPVYRLWRDLLLDEALPRFSDHAAINKYLRGDEAPVGNYADRIKRARELANDSKDPGKFWNSVYSTMRRRLKLSTKAEREERRWGGGGGVSLIVPIPDRGFGS